MTDEDTIALLRSGEYVLVPRKQPEIPMGAISGAAGTAAHQMVGIFWAYLTGSGQVPDGDGGTFTITENSPVCVDISSVGRP